MTTFNIGNLWYAQYTLPFMRQYAERVGAELCIEEEFPSWFQYGAMPHWIMVDSIKRFAAQDRYETGLFLDLDQLVTPSCPDVFNLIGDGAGVVADMGIPQVDGPFEDWCQEWFGELPQRGAYFNAGLLVISRNAARRLLSVLTAPYPDGYLPDNHYLNLKLTKREPVTWLPLEFNWLAPQYADPEKHHIIHFVGGMKSMLPEFTARLKSPVHIAGL
ncbi:MAG TPA: hypothetical protein VFG20_18055 [Planctomycetaceae bacterium]|nr:hypothetical protein [Planctomycetaceae bacterium]